MNEEELYLRGEREAIIEAGEQRLIEQLDNEESIERRTRNRFVEKLQEKHVLEELFGPIIGALLLMLFQGLFGDPPETEKDIEAASSRLYIEYEKNVKGKDEQVAPMPFGTPEPTPDQSIPFRKTLETHSPNPAHNPQEDAPLSSTIPEENPLLIEPDRRINQALQEIFDWALNVSPPIDPMAAESIKLMVANGYEMAHDIIKPMSYPTLAYLHEKITEIDPKPGSELLLIDQDILAAMDKLINRVERGR